MEAEWVKQAGMFCIRTSDLCELSKEILESGKELLVINLSTC